MAHYLTEKHPQHLRLLSAAVFVAVLMLLWQTTPIAALFSPQLMAHFFAQWQSSIWAIPLMLCAFLIGTAIFFPLTILVISTAIAFPPAEACAIAFTGALCSACCGYGLGRALGAHSFRFFTGNYSGKIVTAAKKGGIPGITILRLLPIAPLGIVDVTLGIMKIPFTTYFIGTMLGLMPGIAAFTLLGHSLSRLWHDRDPKNLIYVGLGTIAWISLILLSHFIAQHRQAKPTT